MPARTIACDCDKGVTMHIEFSLRTGQVFKIIIFPYLVLLSLNTVTAAEIHPAENPAKSASNISFSGHLTGGLACTLDCGNCCTGNIATDNSKTLTFTVGSSDADLKKVYNDGVEHLIKGYFYSSSGSCGMGKCTFFHVTSIDKNNLPSYDAQSGRLSIPAVAVDGKTVFSAALDGPFTVAEAAEITGQGGDCSKGQQCAEGYSCVSYFGIAGNELKSCEIPCGKELHCPIGQTCISISDGPQNICYSTDQ